MKKFFATCLLCVLMATTIIPPVSFAENNFTIVSFKLNKTFSSGEKFVIQLDKFSDLSNYTPEVSIEDVQLNISKINKNIVEGVLPDNLPEGGGYVLLKYGEKEIRYNVKIPYITNVQLPSEIKEGAKIIINGGNFDPEYCKVFVDKKSMNIESCSGSQITVLVDKSFKGGDLNVHSNRFTAEVYPINFNPPKIDFIQNKKGFVVGGTIDIFGDYFSKGVGSNSVYLGEEKLNVISVNAKGRVLKVQLPKENSKGNIKVVVNGIESNSLPIEFFNPPVLLGYQFASKNDKKTLKLAGRNFSKDIKDNSVTIMGGNAKVISATTKEIEAEIPFKVGRGCVAIGVNGKKSNCIQFVPQKEPVIRDYKVPNERREEGGYEWILSGDDLIGDLKKISVYVNGRAAKIKSTTSKKVTIELDSIPEKGDIYIIANGIKGKKKKFDFGKFFYPSIRTVSATKKFEANGAITIEGNNFGHHRNARNLKINLSKGGIDIKNEKTKEVNWKITPTKITARLNSQFKEGDEIKLSVSVKGKKSNDVYFKIGSGAKRVNGSPWIHEVAYPDGAVMGKNVRIRGRGFGAGLNSNKVFFGDTLAEVKKATEGFLDVVIPSKIEETGDLKIKNGSLESNLIKYIVVKSNKDLFNVNFLEEKDKNAKINKEVSLGKLVIDNKLGNVLVKNLSFKINYVDDKDNEMSVSKFGTLPFDEFKISSSSGVVVSPSIIKGDRGSYTVSFSDFIIDISEKEQVFNIKSFIRSFAIDKAKIQIKLNPSKDLTVVNLDNQKKPKIKLTQKEIKSEWTHIEKSLVTCSDTDSKNSHCSKIKTEKQRNEEMVRQQNKEVAKQQPKTKSESDAELVKKRIRKSLSREWANKKGPVSRFSDVPNNSDAIYINELKKRGVVQGFSKNEFRPKKSVNRAEFLKMVVAGLQIEPKDIDLSVLNFADVELNKWFTPFVAWGVKNEVVRGYNDGTFRPNNKITRAEAIKIVLTAGAFNIAKNTHTFTDLNQWQHEYVAEAVSQKIINSGNTLRPNENIDRSEAARLIALMLHAYEKEVK